VREGYRPNDGKIKEAPRTASKPLTWLVFVRGRRSARVLLEEERPGISNINSALTVFQPPEALPDERPR